MKHCSCNSVATASFQQFIMPTVHNLHQPLFGDRPSTAPHSLGRHDQRTDRLDSNLPLAPLDSDSLDYCKFCGSYAGGEVMVMCAWFRPRGCRAGPLAHVGRYDCYRECIGTTRRNFEQKQLQKLKKTEGGDISAKPRVAERAT